jgi:AraC-like DNA-binding protein
MAQERDLTGAPRVNSAGFIALDNGIRGAAAGLFLMIAVVILRDRPATNAARLSTVLAVVGAAYAITAAPGFPAEWRWWSLPLIALSSSGPITFWLWARAAFDDDFDLRPWHGGLWTALIGLKLVVLCGAITAPAASAIDRALTFANLGLLTLAVAQTLATWPMDLLSGRRRLRSAVLIGNFAYVTIDIAANLSSVETLTSDSLAGNFARALGSCLFAVLVGWGLFRMAAGVQALAPAGESAGQGAVAPVENGSRPEIEPALIGRLERLMTVERAYRREGLTIGSLAALMHLPEYRLRQIINEGLGHRNFNAFLNRYRIDEAKTALADSGQKDVPVLTIAMDAGFQSLGPFNRAFKADTGLTPTEFRGLALAKAPPER